MYWRTWSPTQARSLVRHWSLCARSWVWGRQITSQLAKAVKKKNQPFSKTCFSSCLSRKHILQSMSLLKILGLEWSVIVVNFSFFIIRWWCSRAIFMMSGKAGLPSLMLTNKSEWIKAFAESLILNTNTGPAADNVMLMFICWTLKCPPLTGHPPTSWSILKYDWEKHAAGKNILPKMFPWQHKTNWRWDKRTLLACFRIT